MPQILRESTRCWATLGRLDELRASGQIDALLASCARFAEHTAVLQAHRKGESAGVGSVRIGGPLVFELRALVFLGGTVLAPFLYRLL